MSNAPIGIFDSGLGGLTVARSIMDKLPQEQILYVGDTAHTPYGTKPIATVRELALNVMDELASRGVKMLVIACNTASAAVLRDARERYEVDAGIPVVEVIQPASKAAVAATRNRKIGVIATAATVTSGAYKDAFAVVPDLEVTQQACPRFVEFVEKGITTGAELNEVAREYLDPVKTAGVDTLVLGCTHYPLLTGLISQHMGERVTLISSSESAANEVYQRLVRENLTASEVDPLQVQHEFYGTGSLESFAPLARRFLGPVVGDVRQMEVPA
ncbi:glutamate racemase [Gleimia coleocanis DSM 15436]|uniref:Glutamate racemase n=1 Tax=Gleimia coleocanis DSM 15436 TaxID=525245 RepID=C0W0S9_9ACTO|nr:glutamate racemase [Gleimia coleocanis]EEH63653.1 glutamate racemase [Gleimia coleocanis DSM 15436]